MNNSPKEMMMKKKKVSGEFPEFCYKFFKLKKYADQFIERGTFRLGNLSYYTKIEDTERRDPNEGSGHTKEPGMVTAFGVSPNPDDKIIVEKVWDYTDHCAEMNNPIFCFCTCLPDVNLDKISEKFGSKYVVKINEPRILADEIRDYLFSQGENFQIVGCKVIYNEGQKLEKTLTVNKRLDLSYKQKSPKYKKEFEFRFVAMKLSTVTLNEQRKFIEVNLNKRLRYLSMQKPYNQWLGMLKRVVIVALFIGIVAAGVWILSGPKKELSTAIQWSRDGATGQIVPIFLVSYKWDGVEDWSETWMIFPKQEKWWVADIREFMITGTQKNVEQSLHDRWHEFSQEFNEMWISDRRFQPAPSRYEAVMMGIGFNVLFTAEKDVLRNVLEGTQAFDEGHLRPEE